jgi:sugar phosphate isomerase/epimerase
MIGLSRRKFLEVSGIASLACAFGPAAIGEATAFKVCVISDEISDDFDHVCSVIAKDFGLHWVELRGIYGKNLQQSSDAELAKAEEILRKYGLQVTDIASPLFKVNWPGAPVSHYGSAGDLHGATDVEYKQQGEVLERSIALAKGFKTNKVRCFDFWRLDDVKPYRAAINEHLGQAADVAAKQQVMLVLENEFECNTATGREAGETLSAIPNSNLALNWDTGNAVMRGALDAFPNGWNAIPKQRLHHCRVKNATKDNTGTIVWAPVDQGYVDWAAQFRALKAIGYSGGVSLETHWRGGGSPEPSSRASWAGMKKRLEEAG